jgi:predicted DNA-binding protein (MmcQ/YjbR family)
MTESDFRKLALSLPDAKESSHMGHPDFRVCGRIFATIHEGLGMVKLTPDQQEMFIKIEPEAFQPVKGGWGLKGATHVVLKKAKKTMTREALLTAWRNVTTSS